MKFRQLIVAMFAAAALSMLVLFAYGFFTTPNVPEAPVHPGQAAELRGFAPGADVTYKIMSPGQKDITAETKIAENGALDIPTQGLCQDTDTSLTYDFAIQEPGDPGPVTMTLKLKTSTGEMSVSGQGLEKFGAVSLKGNSAALAESRADWAGVFRHHGMWKLDPEKENSFELAFFSNNMGGKAPGNPRLIKVFTAPTGGGFIQEGVNSYWNLWCESLNGRMVPSTCSPEFLEIYQLPYPLTCPTEHMRIVAFNIMNGWIRAMKMATEQMVAVMFKEIAVIGKFIDAKQQLETQRAHQLLIAEAHKDYMPSDTMCRFGSFIKSVPDASERVRLNKEAMNSIIMEAYTNQINSKGAGGYDDDIRSRLKQFREVYCDPFDNNNGLSYLCEHGDPQDHNLSNNTRGAAEPNGIGAKDFEFDEWPVGGPTRMVTSPRMNKDIDYPRTMDFPPTLAIDFTNSDKTADEEDVLALARNLYWPFVFQPVVKDKLPDIASIYQNARSIAAMQNVAHNSFVQIAAMKSEASTLPPSPFGSGVTDEDVSGWNFMKSMFKEMGLIDSWGEMEINVLMGVYPSYYSQMEVLTKKMYQNPDFYTNLIDTPANLDRIYATMDTLRVMQMRDQYESRLRQEMLTSMMVEEVLRQKSQALNDQITTNVSN